MDAIQDLPLGSLGAVFIVDKEEILLCIDAVEAGSDRTNQVLKFNDVGCQRVLLLGKGIKLCLRRALGSLLAGCEKSYGRE